MTTNSTIQPEQPDSNDLLTAKTICLSVVRGRFGSKRKASLAPVTVDADKELLTLSKRILVSPELKKIEKHDGHVSRHLKDVGQISKFMRGGNVLIALPMVKSVNDDMVAFATEREALVEEACKMYQQRCEETQARLRVLGNTFDYPPVEVFRASFYFAFKWVAWQSPEKLKAISPEVYEQELAKHRAELSSIADDCRNAMRAQLLQLVKHLRERLQPDAEGKAKKFAKNTVENIGAFLDMFEMKDATGDNALGDIVKQARAVLNGVDVKVIKSDDLVKQKIDTDFAAIEAALQTIVVEPGTRRIKLDDAADFESESDE